MLIQHVADFDPTLLNAAFVFVLLGYGTKVGLAPLHAWLPDAHAEGPTPISAVLSGLLLNVALFAVLRFKSIMSANPAALAPGPLMVSKTMPNKIAAELESMGHTLKFGEHALGTQVMLGGPANVVVDKSGKLAAASTSAPAAGCVVEMAI